MLETKTTGRPCELDRLLWRSGRRPVRLSKYACGVALTAETPDGAAPSHHRWHRLVRDLRDLTLTPSPTS
ncbi:hypothetical protein GCM10025875_34170 [Litorihabitans aurantiacus]|uniref:Uncharacterized protein n=1 Tax=Litorihabitans aurantiacus TaxID=1930061 RepID=A0AA37XJA1_9MICO|nr:hypothetical protein GCM10025875_34170 [Litorihabitans aurantiacus]